MLNEDRSPRHRTGIIERSAPAVMPILQRMRSRREGTGQRGRTLSLHGAASLCLCRCGGRIRRALATQSAGIIGIITTTTICCRRIRA